MVQRSISDMGSGRPTANASSNDDSNWSQRFSVTEGDPHAVSLHHLQALIYHCNIDEIMYRLSSGTVFQVTRTHPEPREVHNANFLTRQNSRSSADAVEDFDCEDVASQRGQAHGLSRAGRGGPTPKRKRRGSGSPIPASRNKRKPVRNRRAAMKSGHDSDSEDEEDELEGAETETVGIRIADVYLLYYDIAFRSISQLCCKDIAKAWIRICHPKKQTSHPYNGGKSNVQLSLAEYGYLGHFTKPDYWPSDENWSLGWGCRHREPDHVKKPERLILLLHLLRVEKKNLKNGDFSLDKMKKSTEGIHLECGKHWTTKCVERLKEIYRIRDLEMQFKRGEIDGDTLVYVQMPKPRSKAVRKTPQSPVNAAGPPSEQLKREPEETSSTMGNAPVANMGTNVQIEDEDLDLSEVSEPSSYADTSSSIEEVALDKSYAKSELCGARTIQHGLPFISSLSPTDRDSVHNPVQENWTPQTASLGRGATVFPQPNSFGCVATPGEAPRLLPSRDQFRSGSSSTQSFPNQEVPRRRYDNESAASQRAANQMRPNERFTRAPAARPVGPKVEITCPQPFASSSSGLAGAFPDYSSWQTNNLWNAQIEPSIYTAVADPSASLVSSTNGSFSSGYSDASLSSGLQWDTWNRENQTAMPLSHQGFDEEFLQHLNLQRGGVSYLGYQPLDMNTPSGDNSGLATQYPYTADVRTEHKFDPFSQHQRQL